MEHLGVHLAYCLGEHEAVQLSASLKRLGKALHAQTKLLLCVNMQQVKVGQEASRLLLHNVCEEAAATVNNLDPKRKGSHSYSLRGSPRGHPEVQQRGGAEVYKPLCGLWIAPDRPGQGDPVRPHKQPRNTGAMGHRPENHS